MCGIACFLGKNFEQGQAFGKRALSLLGHRGPDDSGIYSDDNITMSHTRLSILDLSQSGHQPMFSSCERYVIVYNGEIYNHLDLRKRFLDGHPFSGHSDTETIIELFRLKKEKMLAEMVGMWSIIIWDRIEKIAFISRSRFGQKPLYVRRIQNAWTFSSEISPLLIEQQKNRVDATAVVEYLALGNYGHLGVRTFFDDIKHFPADTYVYIRNTDPGFEPKPYWYLPNIDPRDKVPFDPHVENELHNRIIDAVLSETISDVPIGVTLSGGVDSSIITGILARYYSNDIHIFTGQSPDSHYDETKYVQSVVEKFGSKNLIVHNKNLNDLSFRETIEKYIAIQEEPFGDPSIIAHGSLMEMASQAGIKVILNGQGADEIFFGYNNLAQAILSQQFKYVKFSNFKENLKGLNLGNSYMFRTLLKSLFPFAESRIRMQSRLKRRKIIADSLLEKVDNDPVYLSSNSIYDIWRESIYGVHIPHLVHYDDRNAMAYSVEGRMPFLDHRIVELVATIRPDEFLQHGLRKYILRKSCQQYIPDIIYNRKDKIGFYTPLIKVLNLEKKWALENLIDNTLLEAKHVKMLKFKLENNNLHVNEALQIWRCISAQLWMNKFMAY